MPDPVLKLKVDIVGAPQGAAQLDQVAKATDKTAVAAKDSAGATQQAAQSANSLGDALQNVGGKTNNAKDVVEGLSQASRGGAGSLFGLAKAWQGLVGAFSGAAAGPLGLVVLALTAIKTGLDFVVDRSTAAKNALSNFAGEGERTKAALDQIKAASQTAFANQKAEVDALTESYKSLNGEIDAAAARVDKLQAAQTRLRLAQIDQQEAETLAKASPDPALRDNIRRDFSRQREDVRTEADRARIENTALKAGVEEKAAQEALIGFRQQLDAAALATKQASDAAETERSKLANVDAETVNTDFGRGLRDAVKVAEAAAKAAAANEVRLREALAPQISEASQRITGARDTRQLADVERRTLDIGQETNRASRRTEDLDRQRQQEQERQKKVADGLRGSTAAIESVPAFNADPVKDAASQQAAAVTQKFTESAASVSAASQAILAASSALPAPVDLGPINSSFSAYHQAVMGRFTQVSAQITSLERSISVMRQQIQSQSNASK